MDECKFNISDCDVNANCTNTHGSYKCTCKVGYIGDGCNLYRPLLGRKFDFSKHEIIGFTIREKKVVNRTAIRLKMEKMRWTITETDNGRSFLFTKFSVIDFLLTDKRNIFMYTAEIGLWQIFQLSISATRNTITQVKDLTLGFSFRILFYFPFQEILSDIVY